MPLPVRAPPAEVFVEHARPVVGVLAVELFEDRILDLVDDEGELLAHEAILLEVADPKADAADLVRIGGADAAPRGAQAVVSPYFLFELVEERVVAHDHVSALADDEVLGLDATLSQLGDLLEEDDRDDDDAVADDAGAVRVEDAARD